MPRYEKVQFIAYVLDTTPAASADDESPKYLEEKDGARDIAKRCGFMADAIRAAHASPDIARSDKTLKLFMAPESYFRSPAGAYPIAQVSDIMEKLRAATAKDLYKDWMFVCGTALGYLDRGGAGAEKELFDIALVQRGGISDAVYRQATQDGELTSAIIYTEQTRSGACGGNIFTMHGLIFGLEIGLDHRQQLLRTALSDADSDMQDRIQIQLVPSAGVEIEKESVIVCNKGLVFHVDGGGAGAAAQVADLDQGKLLPVKVLREQALAAKKWGGLFLFAGTHAGYFKSPGKYVVHEAVALP